jgi:hypothetical protein
MGMDLRASRTQAPRTWRIVIRVVRNAVGSGASRNEAQPKGKLMAAKAKARNNLYKVERIDNERNRSNATLCFVVAAANPQHARAQIAEHYLDQGFDGLADIWGSQPFQKLTKITRLGIANVTLKAGIIAQGA